MEEAGLIAESAVDNDVGDPMVEELREPAENTTGPSEADVRNEVPCPTVGLEFESLDDAYDFYNLYAKDLGFGVRVRSSWFRPKDKVKYRAKFACNNRGYKKGTSAKDRSPETKPECPAMIVIRLTDSGRWSIVDVQLEHHHPMSPEIPKPSQVPKPPKKGANAAKKKMQEMAAAEVRTIKLYGTSFLNAVCNGNTNNGEAAIRNPIEYPKHLALKEGDAHALYNYFCRMKLANPNFFYLVDLDEKGCLRNVFWADFRSRLAYSYFSDTVAIDTTSLASRYDTPLICFVGVNSHGLLTLLGCAFIGQQTVENFIWIFKTWLTCMLGHPPQVIITDQCGLLKSAVSQVFPTARHCYSLSYIMQRVPEKLGGLKGYEEIKRLINTAVYHCLKVSEFEKVWNDMMRRHELEDTKWLQTLFEDREQWVPVYLKDVLFAGMIPIEEHEVVSPFFDGYVHKHSSCKDLFDKYDLALQRNLMKEAMEDLQSRNSSFELKTECRYELQLAKVYTREIFRKFQAEVEGMSSCFNAKHVKIPGSGVVYLIEERLGKNENQVWRVRPYEVFYEASNVEVRCICSLFNFKGYLCRHALSVLDYNGVEEIPSKYILPRWVKDFKRECWSKSSPGDIDMNDPVYWHSNLYKTALQVVQDGAKSKEHYDVAVQELEDLLSKLSVIESEPCNEEDVNI